METKESFTPKDVMALRQRTGLGMMDCKKALAANDGNMDAAEQWLRERMKGKMDRRTERTTGEGRIGIAVEGSKAVIIEVQTETDFTARNEAFVKMVETVTREAMGMPAGPVTASGTMTAAIDEIRITTGENANFARGEKLEGGAFGHYLHHDGKRGCLLQIEGSVDPDVLKGVCQHIVFHDPMGIDEKDVPAEQTERIRAEALAEAKESGKNDEIAAKIADGKVRKHLEEHTLMNQKYVLDESRRVKDVLGGAKVKRFVRYTLGG